MKDIHFRNVESEGEISVGMQGNTERLLDYNPFNASPFFLLLVGWD